MQHKAKNRNKGLLALKCLTPRRPFNCCRLTKFSLHLLKY